MMRPGVAGGVAAVLLLIALIAAGRAMIGLAPPTISSSGLRQADPTPTKTPKPDLKVSPSSAVPNQTVALSGTDFTDSSISGGAGPAGAHQITGSGSSLITLDDVALQSPEVEYPVDLASGGNLLVTVVIPVNSSTIVNGSLVMKVTDSAGQSDTANLTIPKRTLTITPDEGSRGSLTTAKGTGFPASNPRTTVRTVRLDYGGISVGTATTDAEGKFETTFTVPLTAGIPSSNTVTATGVGTTGTATDSHKVPIPTLTLTPDKGAPGTTIEINGSGFPGYATTTTVDIGDLSVLPSPAPTTLADGKFSITVLVPQLELGVQVVRLTVGTVSSVTIFTIVDPDPTPTPLPTSTPLPLVDTGIAMEPLADNFLEIWQFDNATQDWTFYLPDPDFAEFNSLDELATGKIYILRVREAQTVTLNSTQRELFQGWNTIAW
ncbi:MAG: hypothetical protein BZY88_10560 [SAR202 cluster bacterium Io17-Chloro-G9]|nr:MAG: hypothetical protein BZY88_10560 [SAR202 cluster bacterium Io17-Chloro-G9]